MTFKCFCYRLFILFGLFIALCVLGLFLFKPIFNSTSVIIPYSLHPYDICITNPSLWANLKKYFVIFYLLSNLICSFRFSSLFISRICVCRKTKKNKKIIYNPNELSLLAGKNEDGSLVFIPEKGLYQNILVTGTIGTGKTSSCMYPFTRQLIAYNASDDNSKLGMLILDVKGNFYKQVEDFCRTYNRIDDLFIIDLSGNVKYNPLDKPNLKPSVLAGRLKTILMLFSPNNSESYWLDKVEQVLTEAIKFCRLYNNGYVTFVEIHKLVTISDYYIEKLGIIKNLFTSGKLSVKDCYDALSSVEFFQKEFYNLDTRTCSILKSEITRITNCFVSDYDVLHTFCPNKNEINFPGFDKILKQGKIVVLNMNIADYQNLSKIIATYLKLDFQTEVMSRLASYNSYIRSTAFICDEFQEYVSSSDANFFAQSREAKCINIISTQSYTSLLNALPNSHAVQVIIQNLINKFWFRTDDNFTIDDIQKQIGKEDKIKISKNISESAKTTSYSYFTNSLHSRDSNLSESINEYSQTDFIYDTNFFTQSLETFSCLSFLSNGYHILKPMKLKMIPYFINKF